MKKRRIGTLITGASLGAALGLLFAPRKGEETRKMLCEKLEKLKEQVKELDYNEVRDNIEEKIEDIKKDLEELDKEKVLEIAKEKGNKLLEKIEELGKLAKDKATPLVEDTIEDLRATAIKTTKQITKKLEQGKKN